MKYQLSKIEKESIKNILVIQTAFIGDAILSTAIFKNIKKLLPETNIDVLAIPQTGNLFQNNPHIKNVYEFDKREFKNRVGSFIEILNKIRKNKYDAAISIQSSLTSSFIMLLGGIKIRIGYPRQKLLTHSIKNIKGLHLRKRILRLLEPIESIEYDYQTELFWGEREEKQIADILKDSSSHRKIAIAPGSARFTKQWPKENFQKLISMLNNFNCQFYLIGGPEDTDLCNEILMRSSVKGKNVAGQLSILGSAALISKMDLVISNDSAPLHIANAVKTDVFAIFGPTVKKFGFYPYRESDKIIEVDLDCRPCSKHGGDKCPLGHFKCMLEIKPDLILNEVKNKLNLTLNIQDDE